MDLLIGVVFRNPLRATASVAILVILTGGCDGTSQEPVPTPEATQESMGCDQYRSIIDEVRVGGLTFPSMIRSPDRGVPTEDKMRTIRDSISIDLRPVGNASDGLYAAAEMADSRLWQKSAIEMDRACTAIGF